MIKGAACARFYREVPDTKAGIVSGVVARKPPTARSHRGMCASVFPPEYRNILCRRHDIQNEDGPRHVKYGNSPDNALHLPRRPSVRRAVRRVRSQQYDQTGTEI